MKQVFLYIIPIRVGGVSYVCYVYYTLFIIIKFYKKLLFIVYK